MERHGHTGREELHFVVPRIELATGRSLNIAPPGRASRRLFDTFRSKINAEFGLSDPDDPARRRGLSLPSVIAKIKNQPEQSWAVSSAHVRQAVNDCIAAKVQAGVIRNREQVVRELKAAGFGVVREGMDYITVLQPLTGKRFRLRGDCYRKSWNGLARSAWTLHQPNTNRATTHATTLRHLTQTRSEFNLARYGTLPSAPVSTLFAYERTGNTSPQRFQTIGSPIPAARPAVCQHALGFDEASQRCVRSSADFERTTQRFDRTTGAFARSFEKALTACRDDLEFEPEMEIEHP
jgi:hypothetical protein